MRIHPKAFLSKRRNVRRGLFARTKIIESLEAGGKTASEIAEMSGLRRARVSYHLVWLKHEKLIVAQGKRPKLWRLTEYGQQRLA